MPFSIDPQTGIATNTPDLQPMGAMGAVMTLLNSQKANEIANTLQQQREAQANLESSHAQQYAETTQRANQARQAVSDYLQKNPNATPGDLANVSAPFEDPTEWTKQYRAYSGLQGRLGAADIAGNARLGAANVAAGATGAPLPLARAGELASQGNLADTKASDIQATQPSRINENEARAAYLTAQKILALAKSQGGGLSQAQGAQSWGNVIKLANQIRLREGNLAMLGDEAYQAETAAMKQTYADLIAVAKRSGAPQPPPGYVPDASQVAGDLAGGGAAPPVTGTAAGLPPGAPPVPNMGHDGKTAKNPLGLDLP